MSKRNEIATKLKDNEQAARNLTHYRPRQWADVKMCRMFALWYVMRLIGKNQ